MHQKRDIMLPLPELIHFSVSNHPTAGFRPGQHNVTLSTTTISKHQHIVWCKSYLDILHRTIHETITSVTNRQTDKQTDRQTDGRKCNSNSEGV